MSPIPRGFHPGSRHPVALAWAGVRYRRPNGLRTRPLADWGTRSRDRSHLVTLGIYAVLPAGCCRADATPHPGSRINGGHNVQLRFLQELDSVLFPSQDTRYTAEPEGVPPNPGSEYTYPLCRPDCFNLLAQGPHRRGCRLREATPLPVPCLFHRALAGPLGGPGAYVRPMTTPSDYPYQDLGLVY